MSQAFRALLKKVGSGQHTSAVLTREEAAEAARLMLSEEATPAQIGAFMIAHRIKRPHFTELAGFLDTYAKVGPLLRPIAADYPAIVFGLPYDGRSRTAPAQPLVALMLSAMGCPVLLHGGERMPTKYGLPLIAIWQSLGIDWTGLSLEAIQSIFQQTYQGYLHLPDHFPSAQTLVPYREQIGKRPPQATLELMWCPYGGDCRVMVGYVHPPTENLAKGALTTIGVPHFSTVKGLEGSPDLPRARAAIIGVFGPDSEERLILHARDYGLGDSKEVDLDSELDYLTLLQETLSGTTTPLTPIALWNGGFYLWHSGVADSLEQGIDKAKGLLQSDRLLQQISLIKDAIAHYRHK
ncbi:anthranilate phosphoribosyltransferase family protein [Oscillatoria sp. CS-180]|uniref:anthranilate phosphoribosyltransferase family protein n=1 Tax=Oscillatoria sp. CS-180 TaxID=3021720 RepID=UPI00232C5439|nr:anthranilate phosphoribosyltransferase family protein [Oscillatoria sp. CS-180]MDB9527450.1 anthranilate phosphoribosyltransferase family protein [Oscillatoria sp. CS-180]